VNTIRKFVEATQRIRTDGKDETREINRVDNVVEYTPIELLRDILPKELPFAGYCGGGFGDD
jgi:hypothetical protein